MRDNFNIYFVLDCYNAVHKRKIYISLIIIEKIKLSNTFQSIFIKNKGSVF